MNIDDKPFVSICTPTFNRRPFIEYLIKCFKHQDYPKEKMEWIILDDGTDKIEDMVSYIPQVKYFYLNSTHFSISIKMTKNCHLFRINLR